MESATIETTSSLRTRDGRPVRIYDDNAGGLRPVHGAYQYDEDSWVVFAWRLDGRCHDDRETGLDLVLDETS